MNRAEQDAAIRALVDERGVPLNWATAYVDVLWQLQRYGATRAELTWREIDLVAAGASKSRDFVMRAIAALSSAGLFR